MKLLIYLEKNKFFWWITALSIIFFLLRLPSVIEPYWYGDEGIYQVIGQAIHNGSLLYRDIWDNKPPLLYIIYAIADGDQITIRLMSLFSGILSLMFFFALSMKMFQSLKATVYASLIYIILFATPIMEGNIANAENFILFPVTAAAFFIYIFATSKHQQLKEWKNLSLFTSHLSLLFAGVLLGLGFLLKIVALFDFAAFAVFLISRELLQINKKTIRESVAILLPVTVGFLLPFFIAVIYFASHWALEDFIQAAFFGNVGYVGWQNTFLGIPQGLLILKLLLLTAAISLAIWKRGKMSTPLSFISIWIVFSLFSTFFSGRPYTHYLLVLLPSYCLLIGLFIVTKKKEYKMSLLIFILILTAGLGSYFHLNIKKAFLYYQNTYNYVIGQKNNTAYQTFFDRKTPRDYAVASFINSHTQENDNIFIWGNNPQIYALTHKQPPYKYTVAYHINQNNVSLKDTEQAINKAQPKYIIVLTESEPLPFSIPLYIIRFKLEGATIYERSF